MKNKRIALLVFAIILISGAAAFAQQAGNVRMPIPKIAFDVTEARNPKDVALSLQVLFLLTILTLAPSIALMMTSFTRVSHCARFCTPCAFASADAADAGNCRPFDLFDIFYYGADVY